ncbi:homeobox protein Rhox13-like [Microtus oregoni]|uniref:homeobox protein Rhox13-like n=1 Tax=Microtus oregoni TaxID=111838 RepID=UPI001BB103F7|nr:homeobox protein Rhox13-like [Microtus oregoni]XP_041496363.1 homeobox protein Rhox13-like [Microtus oregoni]XP_041496367.1 homeobox protein Rhox13-like [Microtus oregoni]
MPFMKKDGGSGRWSLQLYEEFNYYEEEIVFEKGFVASTSAVAMEADCGHSGGHIGHLNFRINESNQGQDSERYSKESDANVGESSSHPDSSLELDSKELNTSEAGVARIRQRHQGHQNHFRFTPGQIREMERFFQISQYPNLAARKELARTLKVPEAKLKEWFAKRRVKDRKEKRVLIETTPPIEDIIMLWDTEEDSS